MAALTVLYDEGCGFCTRVAHRLARAGRIEIAPIGSQLGSVLLRDLASAERYAEAHLVDALGRRSSGGAVLAPIARTLKGGSALAAVFDAFPGATERLYGFVARNRGLVSRLTRLSAVSRNVRPGT
jgi:predicted DCC family thiol-disulfide oxidoreductase YuxK